MANFVSSVELDPTMGIDGDVFNLEIKDLKAYEPVNSWHPSSIVKATSAFDLAVDLEFVGTNPNAQVAGHAFNIQYFFESIGPAAELGAPGLNTGVRNLVPGVLRYGASTAPNTIFTVPAGTLVAGNAYRVAAIVNVTQQAVPTNIVFTGYIEGLILQVR